MRTYSLVPLILIVSLATGAAASDLLLAHFDKPVPDADYAASGLVSATAIAAARGGSLGYFPGTPSGAADVGYTTQPGSTLCLPAKGNLDSRQGTIEFFLKTRWDWSSDSPGAQMHPSFLFVPLEAGHLQVYAYSGAYVSFNINDGKNDHFVGANVSAVGKRETENPWKKDEWHHVAVSWTPEESHIFADGKLVARKRWEPALAVLPPKDVMWVGGQASGSSGVLIDELRIQDVAVQEIKVPSQPYTTPLAGTPPAASGAETPWATLPCYRIAAAPTLDGRIEEAVWGELPWIGGFKQRSGSAFAQVPTRFAIGYDDQAIYLAVVCSEPNMPGLRVTQKGRDVQAFMDDAIELFFDPMRKHKPYYQFVFNTVGGFYDGKGSDMAWSGEWQAAVSRTNDAWFAEVRVPFATLGVPPPQAGERWGFNAARDRYASGGLDLSSLSVVNGFHDVQHFADVRFEGRPVSGGAALTGTLNAAYLAESRRLLDSSRVLWKRQLERAANQLTSRAAPEALRAEVVGLQDETRRLGADGDSLAALDGGRLAHLRLSAAMDQVTARLQQSAPRGPLTLPSDIASGLSRRGDLWYFVTDQMAAAVDGRSGAIVGLWERTHGQRLVAAAVDHYWVETVKATSEADELDDVASRARVNAGRLKFICRNLDLPGVTLTKEYWLRPGDALFCRRVTVAGKPREKTLLRGSSRTYFDEAFRRSAYYQRLMHPAIVTDSVRKAADITTAMAMPGFMGQSTDGSGQMCASSLERGLGVGQFLFKVNDEFVYPPRALNMSYWTPWGWEMSSLACFIKPTPFSAETAFMLYPGDHLNFHLRYTALPEWKALQSSYTICPWVRKARGLTMAYLGWRSMQDDQPLHPYFLSLARIPQELMRPDERILYLQETPDDIWGEYPAADGEVLRWREPNTDKFKPEQLTAERVKHGIARLHALGVPQFRVGFYQFPIDVTPGTPPAKAGWYIVNKDGTPGTGWYDPAYKTWINDTSPAFIDYLAASIARMLDYYKTDMIYFDYPYPSLFADWKGEGRVTQTTDWMHLYKRIHEECAKRGAAFYFNSGAGAPFADAGIFEGIPGPDLYLSLGFLQDGWKNMFSDPMLMMKLYEPEGFASYLLHWGYTWSDPKRDSGREITNYALLLGMRAPSASNSEWGDQLKAFTRPGGQAEWLANARSVDMYHRATLELGATRVEDVGLSPCWWREDTRWEAYALRMGPAHILTCLSHYTEPRKAALSANRERLGLQPGRRTFVWTFNIRPLSSIVRQPDPPPAGWDRLCSTITCQSAVQGADERLSVDMGDMPPLLVRLAAVTQVPGALVSAYGQDTQLILPHTLDCRVDGMADESGRRVALTVDADKPCAILAWWPEPWGAGACEIAGAMTQARAAIPADRFVVYGAERFARVDLPAGRSTVLVTAGP